MNEVFWIWTGVLALLHGMVIGSTLLPIRRMKKSLKLATKRLSKIASDGAVLDISSTESVPLFKEKKLARTWSAYLSHCSIKKEKILYSDSSAYFDAARYFDENTNTKLTAILPGLLLCITGIASVGYIFWYIADRSPDRVLFTNVFLLNSIFALANICFIILHKSALFSAKQAMRKFSDALETATGGRKSLSTHLSEILDQLTFFREEQNTFYEVQSAQLGVLVLGSLEPFMESNQKLIENFVSVATTDQQEAMKKLAEYFAEQTTQLYTKQMKELTEISADMTEIQAKTSLSLSNVSEFFELSRDSMERIHIDSKVLSVAFDQQIHQLDALNHSMDANVKALTDLTEYIRNNSRNQNFTIEKLTDFQDRLLTTSDRSREAMEMFFTDFKDHYSSYLTALKAASADMKESGSLIQSGYKDFAQHLNNDVSEAFTQFEEQMSRLTLRFAESTEELREAVDELPDILRQIKSMDDTPQT